MICKDCMYYGNCIMAEPDGIWMACDDFVEKCDNDCEHCEWTECILEKPKENKVKTNKFEEIKLKTTKDLLNEIKTMLIRVKENKSSIDNVINYINGLIEFFDELIQLQRSKND